MTTAVRHRIPRSALALLACVAIELIVIVALALPRSGGVPADCQAECHNTPGWAVVDNLIDGIPLLSGQLVIGLALIALFGHRVRWGVVSGLLAFLAGSAVTVPLVWAYFYYY